MSKEYLEELERLTEYFEPVEDEDLEEALKNIKIRCHSKCMKYDPIDFDLDIIEGALAELKAIKESKEYNTIGQYILKAQEDEKLKVDICEMFGLDNLFPYNDTKAILKELEGYMDRKNQLWVDFMATSKKLKEQEKVIEIIKELISKHCKIELIDGGTYYQIKIKVMGSDYTFGMSITKEEFNTLKEWLK